MKLISGLLLIVQFSCTQSKKDSASTPGPCDPKDNGLKCTKKGYYETIQCDPLGCFCVTANTGLTAFDTYTSDNKTLPKCSGCHNELKKLFADGDVPERTFIPKCDVILGDYEPLQCDAKRTSCYCVDKNTGKEVPKTRKKTEGVEWITCGKTNYTISEQFPATYGTTLAQKDYPVTKGTCKLDRSKGVSCKKAKPSVRYYFDYNTASCLAFEYLGCEGNLNNYKDPSTCIHDCLLVDHSGCSGLNPPARLSNGEAINCALPKLYFPPGYTGPTPPPKVGPKLKDDSCPVNHVCQNKGFLSLCCNQANEDRFHAAYHPKCSNGVEPYSEMVDSFKEIRFGKTCQDNFCPSGYKCEDADVFAYCCKAK